MLLKLAETEFLILVQQVSICARLSSILALLNRSYYQTVTAAIYHMMGMAHSESVTKKDLKDLANIHQ